MNKNQNKRQKKKTKSWDIESKKYNSQHLKLNGWILGQPRAEELVKSNIGQMKWSRIHQGEKQIGNIEDKVKDLDEIMRRCNIC